VKSKRASFMGRNSLEGSSYYDLRTVQLILSISRVSQSEQDVVIRHFRSLHNFLGGGVLGVLLASCMVATELR